MTTTLWLSIATSLIGVIGLLYGLLERAKRQAADSKADTISKSLIDQIQRGEEQRDRYEKLIDVHKAEIDRLNGVLDAVTLSTADLRKLLASVLSWRVQPREGEPKPGSVSVPSAATDVPSDAG